MEDDLQVEIWPPKNRSMTLRFSSGSQRFEQDFTTSVFPFLEQLCDAVRVLHDGFIDETIRLLIGAPECDLCLQAAAESSRAVLKVTSGETTSAARYFLCTLSSDLKVSGRKLCHHSSLLSGVCD